MVYGFKHMRYSLMWEPKAMARTILRNSKPVLISLNPKVGGDKVKQIISKYGGTVTIRNIVDIFNLVPTTA